MKVRLSSRKTVLFALGFLSQCLFVRASYDSCSSIDILNGEEVKTPGKCTTFPECPALFEVLKSPYKTIAEIKLLQRLTCRPDNENPTICCALEDIQRNSTWFTVENKRKEENSVSNDNIVFGMPDQPREYQRVRTTTPEPITVHPNFRSLIPPLTECSHGVTTDRILGGNETSILNYPWLARIGYYSYDEDEIKYLCAGTVINMRYILTAAHCTQEINPEEYEPVHIRFAEKDQHCDEIFGCSDPINIDIERIIPHQSYSKRDKSNDIALIRVKQDIPYQENLFISPVCLPFVEEYGLRRKDVDPSLKKYMDTGNSSAFVAGWGKTRWTNVEGSPALLHVVLPMVSHLECQRSYQNHTRVSINKKQICAGGVRGKDSCGGDSGGGLFIHEIVPVVAKTRVMKTFQFGVVSFGPSHCGVGGLPGVYTSIYAYKDWILDNMEL